MEQEMVSTPVDNAPAFLQLRDKYKQDGVEDTRLTLTKSADLAAKQHVLLASDAPDAWKRPQLKTLDAIGPKKNANRLVPWSVACAPRAPLPSPPARTTLMLGPCKLG